MPTRESTARSRDAESEATRRAILDAAEELLANGGEGGLSIREVCARARRDGADDLPPLRRQARRSSTGSSTTASPSSIGPSPARAAPADPVEALRWALDRYLEYGVAHPTHYRLMFQRRAARPTPAGARLLRPAAAHGRGDRRGGPAACRRSRTPRAAFWCALHGVTSLVIAGYFADDDPAVALVRDAPRSPSSPDRPPSGVTRAADTEEEPRMTTPRIRTCNPFLQGNFAPWRMEGDADDLEVIGEHPARAERHLLSQRAEPGLRAAGPLSLVRRRRDDPRDHARATAAPRYRNRWVRSARARRGARGGPRRSTRACST